MANWWDPDDPAPAAPPTPNWVQAAIAAITGEQGGDVSGGGGEIGNVQPFSPGNSNVDDPRGYGAGYQPEARDWGSTNAGMPPAGQSPYQDDPFAATPWGELPPGDREAVTQGMVPYGQVHPDYRDNYQRNSPDSMVQANDTGYRWGDTNLPPNPYRGGDFPPALSGEPGAGDYKDRLNPPGGGGNPFDGRFAGPQTWDDWAMNPGATSMRPGEMPQRDEGGDLSWFDRLMGVGRAEAGPLNADPPRVSAAKTVIAGNRENAFQATGTARADLSEAQRLQREATRESQYEGTATARADLSEAQRLKRVATQEAGYEGTRTARDAGYEGTKTAREATALPKTATKEAEQTRTAGEWANREATGEAKTATKEAERTALAGEFAARDATGVARTATRSAEQTKTGAEFEARAATRTPTPTPVGTPLPGGSTSRGGNAWEAALAAANGQAPPAPAVAGGFRGFPEPGDASQYRDLLPQRKAPARTASLWDTLTGVTTAEAAGAEDYRPLVEEAFGDLGPQAVENMLNIMNLESGGNPQAFNGNGENSTGLMQVNTGPGANTGYAERDLTDPATNIQTAREIFDRQGYGAWKNAATQLGLLGPQVGGAGEVGRVGAPAAGRAPVKPTTNAVKAPPQYQPVVNQLVTAYDSLPPQVQNDIMESLRQRNEAAFGMPGAVPKGKAAGAAVAPAKGGPAGFEGMTPEEAQKVMDDWGSGEYFKRHPEDSTQRSGGGGGGGRTNAPYVPPVPAVLPVVPPSGALPAVTRYTPHIVELNQRNGTNIPVDVMLSVIHAQSKGDRNYAGPRGSGLAGAPNSSFGAGEDRGDPNTALGHAMTTIADLAKQNGGDFDAAYRAYLRLLGLDDSDAAMAEWRKTRMLYSDYFKTE